MSTAPPKFPTLDVGFVRFAADHPAIIVPITATTIAASTADIRAVLNSAHVADVDVIEWRIDHVLNNESYEEVFTALPLILDLLGELRLLVTLRTTHEGGEYQISDAEYLSTISALSDALSGHLVDIEYSRVTAQEAIYQAQANGVVVVGSYHDFHMTPPASEIAAHLEAIVHAGADIAKVAVMPNSPEDTLEALKAGLASAQKLDRPSMVISMGVYGMASRIAGGIFGSCATFATLGHASAPGQLPVATVAQARTAMG